MKTVVSLFLFKLGGALQNGSFSIPTTLQIEHQIISSTIPVSYRKIEFPWDEDETMLPHRFNRKYRHHLTKSNF